MAKRSIKVTRRRPVRCETWADAYDLAVERGKPTLVRVADEPDVVAEVLPDLTDRRRRTLQVARTHDGALYLGTTAGNPRRFMTRERAEAEALAVAGEVKEWWRYTGAACKGIAYTVRLEAPLPVLELDREQAAARDEYEDMIAAGEAQEAEDELAAELDAAPGYEPDSNPPAKYDYAAGTTDRDGIVVYRAAAWHPDEGQLLSWHAYEPDAVAAAAKGAGPNSVTRFRVPTTQKGLIAWLNSHWTADNG